MFRRTLFMMALAAVGCAGDPGQVVAGRITQGSFPEAVTRVRAVGNATTITANLATDGSFAMQLASNDRYRIEVVSATHTAALVFPRATGAIDQTFYIADSGAAVELGGVHYVHLADLGGGGGGDTGVHPGGDTGHSCGGDVAEPHASTTGDDGATADADPPEAIGCDTGTGGGGDTGGGGADTGGGGADTGGGGGG